MHYILTEPSQILNILHLIVLRLPYIRFHDVLYPKSIVWSFFIKLWLTIKSIIATQFWPATWPTIWPLIDVSVFRDYTNCITINWYRLTELTKLRHKLELTYFTHIFLGACPYCPFSAHSRTLSKCRKHQSFGLVQLGLCGIHVLLPVLFFFAKQVSKASLFFQFREASTIITKWTYRG